jgi:hypothetical protein
LFRMHEVGLSMLRCCRIFVTVVLGTPVCAISIYLPLMLSPRLRSTPVLSFVLQIAGLAAAIVLLVGAYRMVNRRWDLTGGSTPLDKAEMLRMARTTILMLPLVLLTIWGWSYVERLHLPALHTLNEEPQGGPIFLYPEFERGILKLRFGRVVASTPPVPMRWGAPNIPGRGYVLHRLYQRWGFIVHQYSDHRYNAGLFLAIDTHIPIWFLMLLTAPGAAACLRRETRVRRIRSRSRRGLCVRCEYSLTGNTLGVCPECGTAIPPPESGMSAKPAAATAAASSGLDRPDVPGMPESTHERI